jgi:hypothetical protein
MSRLSVNGVDLLFQDQHYGENYLRQEPNDPASNTTRKELSDEGDKKPPAKEQFLRAE